MVKKVESKTTSVKVTFAFGYNKFDNPKVYRKGRGKDFTSAVLDLFKQRGNNFLPFEQKAEIVAQIKKALARLADGEYLKNGPATGENEAGSKL